MSDELEQTRRLLDISQECVRELRAANARLAAECGRKQEWIDAVMGQPSFSSTSKYTYICRPQPLAKE